MRVVLKKLEMKGLRQIQTSETKYRHACFEWLALEQNLYHSPNLCASGRSHPEACFKARRQPWEAYMGAGHHTSMRVWGSSRNSTNREHKTYREAWAAKLHLSGSHGFRSRPELEQRWYYKCVQLLAHEVISLPANWQNTCIKAMLSDLEVCLYLTSAPSVIHFQPLEKLLEKMLLKRKHLSISQTSLSTIVEGLTCSSFLCTGIKHC